LNRVEKSGGLKRSISSLNCPTRDERIELADRRAAIGVSLRPGVAIDIGEEVSAMFPGFPSVRMDASAARKTIAKYVAVLQHLPLWAVKAGCDAAVKRDESFPPSSGELKALCDAATLPARIEAAELESVLKAEVYHERSSPERARVIAGLKDLVGELRSNTFDPYLKTSTPRSKPYAMTTREEAQANLDRMAVENRPVPPLSPAARKSIGLRPLNDRHSVQAGEGDFEEQMD
jgi:hypothetical protein